MSPEDHLKAVLDSLGYRADPEGRDTPGRLLEVLEAFAPGKPAPRLECFEAPGQDLVVLRALPFHSLCAHHLLPFFGEADIAYRPSGRIAGLGGIARALRHVARQPQLQERLGASLAEHLHAALSAPVGVRLRARQMCMEMRGIESPGTVETLAWRGEADEALRRALG
ncbi:MAG: GTP cyclohydrolase I [Myxococcota bacterium]|jgi:GTP cyclohydrolase I